MVLVWQITDDSPNSPNFPTIWCNQFLIIKPSASASIGDMFGYFCEIDLIFAHSSVVIIISAVPKQLHIFALVWFLTVKLASKEQLKNAAK